MAKDWIDPEDETPKPYVVVELMGITCSDAFKVESKKKYSPKNALKQWRISAFITPEKEWLTAECLPVANVFFNEPYRWRDLIP